MACHGFQTGGVSRKTASAALVKIAFSGACLVPVYKPSALGAFEFLTVASFKNP